MPDVVRKAVIPPARVESQLLAPGVWLMGGQTHNSLLVEFKNYLAVVEAPNNEARSLAVIAEAYRLVPSKPIQYVINTHHHFDHSGGLRTYLSQGTTIVTHEMNKPYYLDILFHPAPRDAGARPDGEVQPDVLDQPAAGADRSRVGRDARHGVVRHRRRRPLDAGAARAGHGVRAGRSDGTRRVFTARTC